jgi:hypothetical protein
MLWHRYHRCAIKIASGKPSFEIFVPLIIRAGWNHSREDTSAESRRATKKKAKRDYVQVDDEGGYGFGLQRRGGAETCLDNRAVAPAGTANGLE